MLQISTFQKGTQRTIYYPETLYLYGHRAFHFTITCLETAVEVIEFVGPKRDIYMDWSPRSSVMALSNDYGADLRMRVGCPPSFYFSMLLRFPVLSPAS
jgi:hypothetical protein